MKNSNVLSRRSFSTALAAAPWVARAQQGPLRARIKIDTERVIGEIDPKIYGNFIEHLGRCIDGGIFERSRRFPTRTDSARTCWKPPRS